MAGTRKRVDWDAIEPHYRANVRSLKDIGEEFGVSDAAIIKHARTADPPWERDLGAKIKAKADAKLAAALVATERADQPAAKLTEAVRIEVESEVQARIRLSHRRNVTRMQALVLKHIEELETQTESPETFETLRELVSAEPDPGDKAGRARAERMQAAFDRALSLGGRTKTLKDLSDTLKSLVALERQAYGVDKWVDAAETAAAVDPVQGAKAIAFILARGAAHIKAQEA